MERHKTVLTTGEVAKICSVAPRTVSKWFDAGPLRGSRIPGSKDRRIPVDQLIRFMRAHGIPLNGLDGGKRRVLVLDADAALSDALRTALENDGGFEVTTVGSALEAGAAAVELKPHVIVVDVSLPDVIPQAMVRFQRSNCDLQTTSLIGVSTNLSNGQGQALLQQGFAGFLSKPFETAALIRVIEQTANFTPAHTVG